MVEDEVFADYLFVLECFGNVWENLAAKNLFRI